MIALSCGICSALSGIVTKYACDRQTDGRTDRITTANTALRASRGKIMPVVGKQGVSVHQKLLLYTYPATGLTRQM